MTAIRLLVGTRKGAFILTSDGKIHQGTIKSQTPEALDLMTAEGKVIRIPIDEIEAKKISSLSPMPNGLADGMTLANFADIIAYLESLKQSLEDPGRLLLQV